jgi:hypothetical protein
MVRFPTRLLLLIGLVTIAGPTALMAAESIVMPTAGPACKWTDSDNEVSVWHCPGPAGYAVGFADFTTRVHLSLYLDGQKPSVLTSVDWSPGSLGMGSRIEWRMANGKPFAAIVGRWRSLEEDPALSAAIEEMLVVKVTSNGGCAVGTVGALSPGALAAARDLADTRAVNFRCGTDNPTFGANVANGGVSLLDRRFGSLEMLEHNESLVEFSHSPSGAVEIRYREPKASLRVAAGTLLFRGQERAGEIAGNAFLFTAGCQPAEYRVSGRRTDGILVLEGNAPRRDPRSCAVLPASKTPKPSRLVFFHEPVVVAAAPQDERRVLAQCAKCMSATIKTIEGIGTDHARVTAEFSREDVRDYCENWYSGSDRIPACIKDNSGELGKMQEASANCAALIVRPSSGGEYKLLNTGTDSLGPDPTWTDMASGKAECEALSCNSGTATAHFEMLCPRAIAGRKAPQ